MEKSIYKFILRRGFKEQFLLVLITLISFPFFYLLLQLPKEIINKAIGGTHFPMTIMGYTIFQFDYLVLLCVLFLGLVIISGIFKYFINNLQGRVGERLLAEFRTTLYENMLRFPLPLFRKVSSGELVTLIASEVQTLGGFISEAIAVPVQNIGTLLTIFIFMFIQNPLLGLAAVALYPVQMYFIPKLQRQVNALSRERVKQLRTVSKIVGETAAGIVEIHTNNNSPRFLKMFEIEAKEVYNIRFDLFQKKFFIKFLNNFIGQLTPFFFYLVGGYYVIQGELTLGALVAILAAYEKLATPWKALLGFYQRYQDTHIKYAQILDRFNPPGMLPPAFLTEEEDFKPTTDGIVISNVDYESPVLGKTLDGITFSIAEGQHVAVVGHPGSGAHELSLLLSGLVVPSRGHIYIAGHSITTLSEFVMGRYLGYIGEQTYIFSDSIYENIVMAFPGRPEFMGALDQPQGGNKRLLDYVYKTINLVDLRDDIFQFGLGTVLEAGQDPHFEVKILQARRKLQRELKANHLIHLVDTFDPARYMRNMSIAENLLFGVAQCEVFSTRNLAKNPYIHWVLEKAGLRDVFIKLGIQVASIVLDKPKSNSTNGDQDELSDLIEPDDQENLKTLLMYGAQKDISEIAEDDQIKLISLAMQLRPTTHQLDFIDDALQSCILIARHMFKENLPKEYEEKIAFFHPDQYNQAANVRDNILFGRPSRSLSKDLEKINQMVRDVITDLKLEMDLVNLGLKFNVGIGGGRLSKVQQQKIGIARCLFRKPQILIVNDGLSVFDQPTQLRLLKTILETFETKTIVWTLSRPELAKAFDRIVVLDRGKIVEMDSYAELVSKKTRFLNLLDEESK